MKKEKGITLIALIITIIVLIILAGITIQLVLGENGIMAKAKYAKIQHEIGEEKQKIALAFNAVKIEKLAETDEIIVTFMELQDQMDIENGEGMAIVTPGEQDAVLIVTYNKSQRSYEIDQDGNVKVKENEDNEDKEPDLKIYSIEDLVDLSIAVENGETYEGKTIVLERSLDFNEQDSYEDYSRVDYGDINEDEKIEPLINELSSGIGFNPIGTYIINDDNTTNIKSFKGTFDGKGNTISNIVCQNAKIAGLFESIENATIKRLTIDNKKTISSSMYAGGISAYATGNTIIRDCNIKGNGTIEANTYVGGLVGFIQGSIEIKNCSNSTNIHGSYITGGIVGRIEKKIDDDKVSFINTYNEGKIEGSFDIAGIIGRVDNLDEITIIQNCFNTADISGSYSAGIIGEIIGNCTIKTISNTYNIGNISGNSGAAGIIGYAGDTSINNIYKCYNEGTIQCYR